MFALNKALNNESNFAGVVSVDAAGYVVWSVSSFVFQ